MSPLVLPPVYAVCDADVCAQAGWTLPDYAAACLDGGIRFLQVRAKTLSSRDFLRDADAIVTRATETNAIVIINDRADLARLAGAGGVHVGQDDLTPADVRRVVGAEAVVGLSTHSRAQLEDAVAQAVNYVAIGPVFGTRTKDTGYDAVGLDMVRAAAATAGPRGLPGVAIGGITLERAADVLGAGATSVAIITDLLAGGDPMRRARAYVDQLGRV